MQIARGDFSERIRLIAGSKAVLYYGIKDDLLELGKLSRDIKLPERTKNEAAQKAQELLANLVTRFERSAGPHRTVFSHPKKRSII